MIKDSRLVEIKQRRSRLASFEWRVEHHTNRGWTVWGLVNRVGSMLIATTGFADTFDKDNAEFIANAPEDIDYLLAHIDEIEDSLSIAINSCKDVTILGCFSKSVDPVRWTAQLQALLEKINTTK